MKRIALFALLAIMVSCSGSGNKYLGNIPSILADGGSREKLLDEQAKLKGVVMPCESSAPEIFSVVGDGAVFDGEKFYFLMEFKKPVRVGSATMNVKFLNTETRKQYGEEVQILFMNSFNRESFCSGESILKSFFVNTIEFENAADFQKNVDLAVLEITPSDFRDSGKDTRASMSVEDWACYFMDSYYETIKANDIETYFAIDYEIGEFDGFTAAAQWQKFNLVTEIWKFIFPEKWQTIREFRKKLIADGEALVDIDVADPSFDLSADDAE